MKDQTRPGTLDVFVRRPDAKCVAFQFSTQQPQVRVKMIRDLEKLASGEHPFADKVSEVFVCFNSPPGHE